MNNEKSIVNHKDQSLSIPEQNVQDVLKISDDIAVWCKLDRGGNGFYFPSQNKTVTELTGVIKSMTPHLVKFEENIPYKLPHEPDDLKIPDGYERRCDLKIDIGGMIVGLSLSPSSFKHQLSPYVRHLSNRGLRPDQLATTIRARMASNNMGQWPIAVFSEAGEAPQSAEKPAVNFDPRPSQSSTVPEGWE
jgi:hypothetical protein